MILMKDIVREDHAVLREVAAEVSIPPNVEEINTLKDMREFLINSQNPEISEKYQLRAGVGLAAPQINLSKRMIAIYFEYEEKVYDYMLINPKIVSHSVQKAYLASGEGCLSVDRPIPGFVPRHARVTIEAFTIAGEKIKLRLKGYPAIVFQHEIDHLNGIMFYDHINKENPFITPENSTAIE